MAVDWAEVSRKAPVLNSAWPRCGPLIDRRVDSAFVLVGLPKAVACAFATHHGRKNDDF